MNTKATIRQFLSTTPLTLVLCLALGAAHPALAGDGSKSEMLVFESTATSKAAGEIVVAGTSSLHDWEVVTKEIVGTLKISAPKGGEGALELTSDLPLVTAQVSIRSESLVSGKGGMDKKMYKALETKKYKEVSFVLDSLELAQEQSPSDSGKAASIDVLAKGKLTITDKTRRVQFPATITWEPQKKAIAVSGEVDLRMTDFEVEPPTALLGTIKTGDEIKVSFTWTPTLK
ncbi:MAG: YceI family protein [Opitutales bacterium]